MSAFSNLSPQDAQGNFGADQQQQPKENQNSFSLVDLSEEDDLVIKYLLVPSALGGLGSVLLQLVGSESPVGSVPSPRTEEAGEESADANEPDLSESTAQTDQTLVQFLSASEVPQPEQPTGSTDEPSPILGADFIPSLSLDVGPEFVILVLCSLFLGMISGFIGTMLSIGAPARTNKMKVASTSMLFGLFFPSMIGLMQQVATYQGNTAVREYQIRYENLAHEKQEIQNENETLTVQNEGLSESVNENNSRIEDINGPEDTAVQELVINNYQSLAINAATPERKVAAVQELGKIGRESLGSNNLEIADMVRRTLLTIGAESTSELVKIEVQNQLNFLMEQEIDAEEVS